MNDTEVVWHADEVSRTAPGSRQMSSGHNLDESSAAFIATERRMRLGQAGLLTLSVAAVDAATPFFCGRFPLVIYLIAGGLGYYRGGRLAEKMKLGVYAPARWRRLVATLVVCFGLLGCVAMTLSLQPSHSKCAWKSCGRALGPGLFVSPFPVPAPTCSYLHMCINEYPYREGQYKAAVELIRSMDGCYEP